jgi:hypothetical protein
MGSRRNSRMYRVVLVFPLGETKSVFVKAKNQRGAERRALRKYPNAIQVDRSPYPQS